MKRLNSNKDDNVPIYIYILLVVILTLSFLAFKSTKMAGTCSMLCLILITLFIPPLGVFMISGCSVDLLINILLTILGYLPGHIHAFYLEYVYYANRNAGTGEAPRRAPGVYSERIQRGGNHHTTYGTIP